MSGAGRVELTDVGLSLPDGRSILRGVSLTLEPGTSTALLGRSGSGKTTLLRMVNGLVRPTSGSVRVNGAEVEALSVEALRRLRYGIGYVIHETGLFPHLTIVQNVMLPMEVAGTPKEAHLSRAQELLARVGLEPSTFGHRRPAQLSGGQRQRVGLARALALSPSILLLDEPFGALDPLTRSEMQRLLKELLQASQTTALLVTHDLKESLYLADKIVFMEDGLAVASLPVGEVEVSNHPAVLAYLQAAEGVSR